MRAGEDHCDEELADEVRRGRKEGARRKEEGGRRKEEGGRKTTSRRSRASDIKSNNPHLAGGEPLLPVATDELFFHVLSVF